MLAKTRGIVLRNTNYRENSLISKIYTREFGIRTYILQSVRKGKSAIKPSMVQPLSIILMDVYEKPNSNIQRVKEIKSGHLLLNIQSSMVKKSIAMFLLEVLNQCIVEENCENELFDFLEQSILQLETEELDPIFPSKFLLSLSSFLGVYPNVELSDENGYFSLEDGNMTGSHSSNSLSLDASQVLVALIHNQSVKASKQVRRELLAGLVKYYQFNVIKNHRDIRSIGILSEILS